ncbi:hypothetical protein T08_11883 [Trichinella sp. T8]|nr:hypothetical protein T08_11883 [Trichinella sp. T8]
MTWRLFWKSGKYSCFCLYNVEVEKSNFVGYLEAQTIDQPISGRSCESAQFI